MIPRTQGRKVTMFAGGRGATSIARELLGRHGVSLSLVINGYDNGQSTGALRRFLPGLLGPSDFRKNLMLHLDPANPVAAAMAATLSHRLPIGATAADLDDIVAAIARQRPGRFAALPPNTRGEVTANLARFRSEIARLRFDLSDCALGNLVLAGAYLRFGRSFNVAVRECARAFCTPVRLVNVTNGENAYLVARKADGRILTDESEIVGPQDAVPIADLMLVAEPPDDPPPAWPALGDRRATVTLSGAARRAILDTHVLVYGPGTPHSSLLPSFLTPGIAGAIADSRARAKVFVVNIQADHDVQGLTPADLVDRTLTYLGDPTNKRGLVTHVLCPGPARTATIGRGLRWVVAELTDPEQPLVHCGRKTAEVLLALADGRAPAVEPTLVGRP